jgi:hypothetical protein
VPETSLTKICIVSASEERLEMLEMLEERRMVAVAMYGLVEREGESEWCGCGCRVVAVAMTLGGAITARWR